MGWRRACFPALGLARMRCIKCISSFVVNPSRRAFFGFSRVDRSSLRPPWAVPEADFTTACTRCSDCVAACPTGLLVRGDGGYPQTDFTPGRAPDGCTFCGACRAACPSGALSAAIDPPWRRVAGFGDDCLASRGVVCRTCGERCPVDAIHFPPRLGGVARPLLDAAACNGCGACLADCPTRAIRIVADPAAAVSSGVAS